MFASNAIKTKAKIPINPIILNFLLKTLKAIVIKTIIRRRTAVLDDIKKIVTIIERATNKGSSFSFLVLDLKILSRQKTVDMTQKNPR